MDKHNPSPYAWRILALLLMSQLFMAMDSFRYGPLTPFFRDELGISRGQVGTLIAVYYFPVR